MLYDVRSRFASFKALQNMNDNNFVLPLSIIRLRAWKLFGLDDMSLLSYICSAGESDCAVDSIFGSTILLLQQVC